MEKEERGVVVLDLRTGKEFVYTGLTPAQAVLAAYALVAMRNGHSHEWQERYGHLLETGQHAVFCGDFGAVLR